MKPALYYTLAKPRWNTPYMHYAVLAVTSEGPRRRINGRYVIDGHPTHMNARDTVGKFETAEQAEAKIVAIKAASETFDAAIKTTHTEAQRLYSEQQKAVEAVIASCR